jgi:uncharacterized membrane-anchored protein/NAD-dependent dihydropyrimidine dehydrogenase PreA subunit
MLTPIRMHEERCDLCGGEPACVPACPQQILAMHDNRITMTHTDRCPDGCIACLEACPEHVFGLVERVHEGLGMVPAERIAGPAFVHHVAYLRDEDEEEKRILDRFKVLCDELKIPEDQRTVGETRAHAWGEAPGGDGYQLQLTWELHTEYYFVRAILDGKAEAPSPERMEAIVPLLQRAGTPPVVTCLEVLVADRPMNPDEVCDVIICRNRFGARVLDGDVAVYTNYEPVNGRERYVVAGTPASVAEHGAFIVRNIGQIENYYHLLMIPRLEVRDTVQEVHRRERDFAARMEQLTDEIGEAPPERLQLWLGELTLELARVVRLYGRFNHVLSATFPYTELVRQGFAEWKEQPVEGFDSLSGIILDRVASVADEYRTFLARLDRMQDEISDLVSILRTRVDMSMEAQNTEVLKNLDARSAIQLRLQQMAEGLSVIVISYYLTGLAGYVFKALAKEGVIPSETVPTALFIPVAVAAAFLVTRKGAHLIKRKKTTPIARG